MVEVWKGDLFIGIMSFEDFLIEQEADSWLSYRWCEGFGP